MQPLAVTLAVFDRVAKRMAKIQMRATAGLAFVLGDHLGLDLAGPLHRMCQRIRFSSQQRRHVLFQPAEEVSVCNRAVLDDLGQSCAQLPSGSVSSVSVSMSTTARLVKRTDQVLALWMIDAGLATDRRIDLRKQRCRYLDEGDAAHVAGGRETRDVANDTPAQRDHGRVAIRTLPTSSSRTMQPLPASLHLAVGQLYGPGSLLPQDCQQFVEVQRRDRVIADDQAVAAGAGAR